MALTKSTVGLLALVLGTAAIAATPADIVTARQANYKQIGKASKAIADQLRSPESSIATIQANAQILDSLAPKLPGWFPKGSGPESGVKTAALPAIWEKKADFRKAAATFAAAARTLRTAAARGDLAQVKTAFPAVGSSCKGCHESFKAKN